MIDRETDFSRRFRVGEIFCGAGGLSRGFHTEGFVPCFANDIWDVALHTFMMNFDKQYALTGGASSSEVAAVSGSVEHLNADSILSHIRRCAGGQGFEGREIDVLLGGPPCQGFSLNSHIRSADDPRNYLFRHYVRLLQELSPKVFVLENVPGMLSLDEGRFFDELISQIQAPKKRSVAGYRIDFKILNAAHYGVPQERYRIVLVGTREDVASEVGMVRLPKPRHLSFARPHFKGGRTHTFHYAIDRGLKGPGDATSHGEPALAAPTSVSEAIADLPPLQNGGGTDISHYVDSSPGDTLSCYQDAMRLNSRVLYNHWCRSLLPPNTERVKHIPPGGDWRSIPAMLLPLGMQRALRKDHTTRYGRLLPTGLSGTLLTKPDPHWGSFLHYDVSQQRLISVREAARIQSFPDTHRFFGSQVDQYKLCGNAVPVMMARAIATSVRKTLDAFSELGADLDDSPALRVNS